MIGKKVIAAICGALHTCLGCDMIQAGLQESNWWFLVGSVLPIYIAHHCFDISVSPFVNDCVFEPLYRRIFPGREIDPNPEDDRLLQPGEDHDERIQRQGGPMPWNLLQVQLDEGVAPVQPHQNIPDGQAQDEGIQLQGGPMPWNLLQVQLNEGVAPAQARRNLLNEFPQLVPDHGELIEQFQPPDHLPNGRPHIMRDN